MQTSKAPPGVKSGTFKANALEKLKSAVKGIDEEIRQLRARQEGLEKAINILSETT